MAKNKMTKYYIILLIILCSCSSNNVQDSNLVDICGDLKFFNVVYEYSVDILAITSPYIEKEVTEPKIKITEDSLLSLINYHEIARRAKVQGIVSIKFAVDKDGSTKDIKLKHGLGAGLDETVITAFKQTAFEPASLNGSLVERKVIALIRFKVYDKVKYIEEIIN